MGYFSFPNEKSLNNEKRRKTLVFLNDFLHGWHSDQIAKQWEMGFITSTMDHFECFSSC